MTAFCRFATGCLAAALLMPGFAKAEAPRCETLPDGVEYRAFLPDGNRFLYAAVKALPGYFPSIFIIVDKNYVKSGGPKDPVNRWWLDRARPMAFASDMVKIDWTEKSAFYAVGSWFSGPSGGAVSQSFRGLVKTAQGYAGTGSGDTNSFAFQTRIEMPGFEGDSFTVHLPAVTFDGVTLTPPPVLFTRDGKTMMAKCE